MFRLKSHQVNPDVTREVWYAVGIADCSHHMLFGDAIAGEHLIITSMFDQSHMDKSEHYLKHAVDLRTRELNPDQQSRWFLLLRAILDPMGFDVVNEGDHIHIEYQPKVGEREFIAYEKT